MGLHSETARGYPEFLFAEALTSAGVLHVPQQPISVNGLYAKPKQGDFLIGNMNTWPPFLIELENEWGWLHQGEANGPYQRVRDDRLRCNGFVVEHVLNADYVRQPERYLRMAQAAREIQDFVRLAMAGIPYCANSFVEEFVKPRLEDRPDVTIGNLGYWLNVRMNVFGESDMEDCGLIVRDSLARERAQQKRRECDLARAERREKAYQQALEAYQAKIRIAFDEWLQVVGAGRDPEEFKRLWGAYSEQIDWPADATVDCSDHDHETRYEDDSAPRPYWRVWASALYETISANGSATPSLALRAMTDGLLRQQERAIR